MKKELMIKTLFELIKNSKRSDREIARSLGLWQSTITRYRKKLEKEGIIRDYTLIPNLEKMGYEILAFQLVAQKRNNDISYEIWNKIWIKKMRELLNDFPEVVFSIEVMPAKNALWNALIASLHKNYSDFSEYMARFLKASEDLIEDYPQAHVQLLTSVSGGTILKPLSLRYLEKKHISQ